MKRPAFQFYPGDWQGNAKLRRCTHTQKGIWMDVLCLMHDSEEYGVLRWPLADVAQAIGARLSELNALIVKGVLKGCDTGCMCPAFVFTPRHAGKDGEPVTLLPDQVGPIWYSSRMVRDEYIRSKRGENTRFESPDDAPKGQPKEQPKVKPKIPFGETIGGGQGDGPSSSSSTSLTPVPTANAVGVADASPPDCPHEAVIALYHEILPECPRVEEWHETRKGYLRGRWREKAKPNGKTAGYKTQEAGLEWWKKFFGYCAQSDFLTGKRNGRDGKPPFVASLEWLVRPTNFAKVVEGNYHR
jgi:hypothetical protein